MELSLQEQADSFPLEPGVYLFKDAMGNVLYVGKAKHLRRRIRNYFGKSHDKRPQIAYLIKKTVLLEFIITHSEQEALLLENTLIKKYQPRYNIELRDDKTHVSIKLSTNHDYPGIYITRHVKKDGHCYFGPYNSAYDARIMVKHIAQFFQIRNCSDRQFKNRIRPCLRFDMKLCAAPCTDQISKTEYAPHVSDARHFLSGNNKVLLSHLRSRMAKSSKDLCFERAAIYRDAIAHITEMLETQDVTTHKCLSYDCIGLAQNDHYICMCILYIRSGQLMSKDVIHARQHYESIAEALEEMLICHYWDMMTVPAQIMIAYPISKLQLVSELFQHRDKGVIRILSPKRGEKKRLLDMASRNAAASLKTSDSYNGEEALIALSEQLSVPDIESIECIDISNIQGQFAIGSLVRFDHAKPLKSRYRLYNITCTDMPNDVAMIHEVICRRFRVTNRSLYLPDLLLIDGGKGQLNSALQALATLEVNIPVIAIAKGKKEQSIDRLFVPGRRSPLRIAANDASLLLCMRIRDEAHRFGITAHRKQRAKAMVKLSFDHIKGIGPKRGHAIGLALSNYEDTSSISANQLSKDARISIVIASQVLASIKK